MSGLLFGVHPGILDGSWRDGCGSLTVRRHVTGRGRLATMGPAASRLSLRLGAKVPDLGTVLLVCAVLLWAGVQYGLMIWAVRDLMRRPAVRGNNKMLWGMLILVLPIVGALVYAVAAPDAPIARAPRLIAPRRLLTHDDTAA
jgi:hypothetical protein